MRETLEELLHRKQFEPFEIRLSNGDAYAVQHPDMAILLKTKIIIGLPETDRFVVCSLLHVASIQSLQAAA